MQKPTVLVGPQGSGKTTTALLLCQIFQVKLDDVCMIAETVGTNMSTMERIIQQYPLLIIESVWQSKHLYTIDYYVQKAKRKYKSKCVIIYTMLPTADEIPETFNIINVHRTPFPATIGTL